MVVCSCLDIRTSNLEELCKNNVDITVLDVYNEHREEKHKPCKGCPSFIRQEIKRLKEIFNED